MTPKVREKLSEEELFEIATLWRIENPSVLRSHGFHRVNHYGVSPTLEEAFIAGYRMAEEKLLERYHDKTRT